MLFSWKDRNRMCPITLIHNFTFNLDHTEATIPEKLLVCVRARRASGDGVGRYCWEQLSTSDPIGWDVYRGPGHRPTLNCIECSRLLASLEAGLLRTRHLWSMDFDDTTNSTQMHTLCHIGRPTHLIQMACLCVCVYRLQSIRL